MSAIGILGGMGPQASVRLVELLIAKTPNFVANPIDSDYPEIIHLSVPVPNFVSNKNNMQKAKIILLDRIKLLEASGSTINCIACNTAHLLLPELQANTKVPFLSIPLIVASIISLNKFKRVGLLATPSTLASNLYDNAIEKNVALVKPDIKLEDKLEQLILKQLRGKISELDRNNFKDIVQNFSKSNKLDAVILGCTELPVIYGPNNDSRIIDSLALLSDALLEEYFKQS